MNGMDGGFGVWPGNRSAVRRMEEIKARSKRQALVWSQARIGVDVAARAQLVKSRCPRPRQRRACARSAKGSSLLATTRLANGKRWRASGTSRGSAGGCRARSMSGSATSNAPPRAVWRGSRPQATSRQPGLWAASGSGRSGGVAGTTSSSARTSRHAGGAQPVMLLDTLAAVALLASSGFASAPDHCQPARQGQDDGVRSVSGCRHGRWVRSGVATASSRAPAAPASAPGQAARLSSQASTSTARPRAQAGQLVEHQRGDEQADRMVHQNTAA